jgi:hypothetical protein
MRIVLFLDLDDTLFQTKPKCPAGEAVLPVAYARDGAPLSFMTQRQQTLFELFARAAAVIPVTGRNFDAFCRVDLPFEQGAVLDFGGVVLRSDRTLDTTWDNRVRPQLLSLETELRSLCRWVDRFIVEQCLEVQARVIVDFDLPLYLVLKHPQGDESQLTSIRRALDTHLDWGRFFLHHNDNNLSVIPRLLGKERAVAYVREHLFGPEPILTVGMADSLTDAPFLRLCDFSLVPGGGQLARRLLAGGEEA